MLVKKYLNFSVLDRRKKYNYYYEFFTFTTVDLLKLNSVPAWRDKVISKFSVGHTNAVLVYVIFLSENVHSVGNLARKGSLLTVKIVGSSGIFIID